MLLSPPHIDAGYEYSIKIAMEAVSGAKPVHFFSSDDLCSRILDLVNERLIFLKREVLGLSPEEAKDILGYFDADELSQAVDAATVLAKDTTPPEQASRLLLSIKCTANIFIEIVDRLEIISTAEEVDEDSPEVIAFWTEMADLHPLKPGDKVYTKEQLLSELFD